MPALMLRTATLIIIIFVAFALSCGVSLNDSKGGTFELEITVVDGVGNPVSGLQVSASNDNNAKQFLPITIPLGGKSSTALRGDINCNGLPIELGDVVMFKNFLLQGETAFNDHVECSVFGGDVDLDGIPLTLSDFVFLFRVFIGDAPPFPAPTDDPVRGSLEFRSGVVTVNPELFVLLLKFEGQVSPTLLVPKFEMSFQYDADSNVTTVLVSPPLDAGRVSSFSDDILQVVGEFLDVSGATPEGRPVAFRVFLNRPEIRTPYPNPASTGFTVSAAFPSPASYTFTITNLEGELQHQVIDSASEAGFIDFMWQPPRMTTTAYKIEMEVTSNDTIFTLDPKYAAIVTSETDDNVIGTTSTRGLVSTLEAWRFPSLFDLPELNQTDAFGNALGSFAYSDSVTVVLKRPNTTESKSYRMHLQRGINRFNLVWPF